MKLLLAVLFCFLNFFLPSAKSQNIKLINTPRAGNETGNGIVYKEHLYTSFLDEKGKSHLARLDGNKLTVVENPDTAYGVAGYPIVYKNKLCLRYKNLLGRYQLARYDGKQLKLIPNPDTGRGFNGYSPYPPSPIIYNGKLYLQYEKANIYVGKTVMAVFDDSTLTFVPAPNSLATYIGAPIIYKNELCAVWFTTASRYQLVKFDGTNFTIIPNPNYNKGDLIGATYQEHFVTNQTNYPHPVIYRNRLFLTYINPAGSAYQLAQFNGDSISLVANPDSGPGVLYNDPVIYHKKLYVTYYKSLGGYRLAEYDSVSLKIINNADSINIYPDGTHFAVYKNKLFFVGNIYHAFDKTSQYQLTTYDGTSIKPISNPDAGNNQGSLPVIYDNKLNFGYIDVAKRAHLAQYNGSAIKLVSNPDTGSGYVSSPVIFNDTLFFVYTNELKVSRLAYLKPSNLQPELLNAVKNNINLYSVYPNPAHNILNIVLPAKSSSSEIIIYDIKGSKIISQQFPSNTSLAQMNINSLMPGVYNVVILLDGDHRSFKLLKE